MARGARRKNLQLINFHDGCGQLIFYSNNDNQQTEELMIVSSERSPTHTRFESHTKMVD